jgi:hypothetical protein
MNTKSKQLIRKIFVAMLLKRPKRSTIKDLECRKRTWFLGFDKNSQPKNYARLGLAAGNLLLTAGMNFY